MLPRYCDRVVLLAGGKLIKKGTPLDVIELGRVRPRVPHGRWRGMTLWYALCDALGAEFLSMNFMKNALLAVIVMAPLFGLLSTMIVTGKMSFSPTRFGHSGFTGIAIGVLCGAALPIWWAVGLAVAFALLFSFVRSRSSQSADTIIGVFFVHSSRPRHLHRHDGRRELYQNSINT